MWPPSLSNALRMSRLLARYVRTVELVCSGRRGIKLRGGRSAGDPWLWSVRNTAGWQYPQGKLQDVGSIKTVEDKTRAEKAPRESGEGRGTARRVRVEDRVLPVGILVLNVEKTIEETGTVVVAEPLPVMTGDKGQLVQLFQNLISNAIKSRRPEETPEVFVGAVFEDGTWLFSVLENGLRMAPQYAEKVFVLFQRLHTRSDYPGTGIGLAICKKVSRAPRRKDLVTVRARAGEHVLLHAAPGRSAAQEAEEQGVGRPMPNTEPIQILLAEDNPGDARLAVEALKDSKVHNNLYHAKDGVEAMAFLRREDPYAETRTASKPCFGCAKPRPMFLWWCSPASKTRGWRCRCCKTGRRTTWSRVRATQIWYRARSGSP